MHEIPEAAIQELSRHLHVAAEFFVECLSESVIEIKEIDGHWDLRNGTVLRLRQLERICNTLNVQLPVALQIFDLTQRVAELEEEIRLLRSGRQTDAR